MNRKQIWQEIELSVRDSKKKFPNWPDHVAAQAGIVCESAGNILGVALKIKYDPESTEEELIKQYEALKELAINTAAVAIRFLENSKKYPNDQS